MATLAQKLQIRPGSAGLLLNAPEFFATALEPLPDGATVRQRSRAGDAFGYVHLFVHDLADLDRLAAKAIEAQEPDAVFWVSYPKRSSKVKTDVDRDCGWPPLAAAGFEGVRQVAVDDTWSALRFRRSELVGRRK